MEKILREGSKRNRKSMAWTIASARSARSERRCPRAVSALSGASRPLEEQGRFDVPSVAPDGVPNGPRPDAGPRTWARRRRLLGEGAGDIQELLRPGPELLEAPDPFGDDRRGILQNRQHPFRGLAELSRRDRLRTLRMLGLFRRLENQMDGVPDSLQDLRAERRAMHELAARLSQGDQVPGQIAAVHGGNVDRLQRPQVPGVVPVAEVAADAVQFGHGLQRGLEPFRGVQNSDPAEVMGAIVLSR